MPTDAVSVARFEPLNDRPAHSFRIGTNRCRWIAIGILYFVWQSAGVASAQPIGQSEIPSTPPTITDPNAPKPSEPAPGEPRIPDFHLAGVQLDAVVENDRINLSAKVEIVVNRGSGWNQIPLRMGQFHLWSREYTGPGEEAPDIGTRPVEDGLFWLIKGVGRHQLTLRGWLPFKRLASGGQFQLSLPPLPPQFESQVSVRIPRNNVKTAANKNFSWIEIQKGENETLVRASVTGNRLDFSWYEQIRGGETVTNSLTAIHVKPLAGQLLLTAEQTIEFAQAGVEEVAVRLPDGYRLARVSSPASQQYRSHELIADRPGWVLVRFANLGPARLELRWDLERELTDSVRDLLISGFQVDGALTEGGTIRVDEFPNEILVPVPEETELVQRTSVSQVRSYWPGVSQTAYEFSKQPYRLTLRREPVAPEYSVEPELTAVFEEKYIELTVDCRISFDRGFVSQLQWNWPQWRDAGWQLVAVTSDSEAISPVTLGTAMSADSLRFQWALSRDKLSPPRSATLSAVFRKPRDENAGDEFSLRLPSVESSHTASAFLAVAAADRYSVVLEQNATALTPITDSRSNLSPGRSSAALPKEILGRFQITDPALPLQVRLTSHERQVEAETIVEVVEADERELILSQLVRLNVGFGRLSGVRFTIPGPLLESMPEYAVPESLDIWLADRKLPLTYKDGVLEAAFPQPGKGVLELKIDYRLPVELRAESDKLNLPVLALKEYPFVRARCQITPVEAVQVNADATGWEPLRTSPRGTIWINGTPSNPLQEIPLILGRRLADTSQQFVVERIDLRTIFAADGTVDCWTEFRIESPPSRLVVTFPPQSEFKEFRVNGEISGSLDIQNLKDARQVTWSLPRQLAPRALLTVRYRLPNASAFGLAARHRMVLPQFRKSVWVDEIVWETRLPSGSHLFTSPEMTPQFRWTRRMLIWRRQLTESYLRDRQRLPSAGIPAEFDFDPADIYAFQGFGPIAEVEFRSMNQSLILLAGAGFTFILGFVFWWIPATRNVFSLVVLAFLFALTSVWYLEPMLLLLQPAILGIVLALTATFIDASSRRKPEDRSRLPQNRPRPTGGVPYEELPTPSAATKLYQPVSAGPSDHGN